RRQPFGERRQIALGAVLVCPLDRAGEDAVPGVSALHLCSSAGWLCGGEWVSTSTARVHREPNIGRLRASAGRRGGSLAGPLRKDRLPGAKTTLVPGDHSAPSIPSLLMARSVVNVAGNGGAR